MADEQVHPANARFKAWVDWLTAKHAAETGEKKLPLTRIAEKLGVSQVLVSQLIAGGKHAGLAAAIRIEDTTRDWPDGPLLAREWLAGRSTLLVKDIAAGNVDTESDDASETDENTTKREPIVEGAAPR